MKIDDYSFGRITIDGELYKRDLKIINGKIFPDWWRSSGHFLKVDDIKDIIEAKPKVVIIGTGAAGVMRVDQRVLNELEAIGAQVHVKKSGEAVELFNRMVEQMDPSSVALAIHLTC